MKLTASITFNIIFVRGTVQLLKLAVVSLLHNSTCRFRLVSNGCDVQENRLLQQWCEQSPRLELLEASRTSVIPHGELLTQLQSDERSPVFAFMDSDIFASGDFLKELAPCLQSADAIFSCPPIWSTEEQQVMPSKHINMNGVFNHSADGTCIGCSYFAIYDNAVLKTCMQETGITLQTYFWDEIPAPIRDELQRSNLAVDVYDTGKLMNILLGLRGNACRFTRLESLCHIGGISGASLLSKHGLLWIYASPLVPKPAIKLLRWAGLYKGRRDKVNRQERQLYEVMIIRRRAVCAHISAYLKHLLRRGPKPPTFRHNDSQLVARVSETEQLLEQLSRRYNQNSTACFQAVSSSSADHVTDEVRVGNASE